MFDLDQLYINNIFVCYREELKKALEKIKNFDDLLCDIVNICLLLFEQKTYLTPAEKHMLVKVGMKKTPVFYLLILYVSIYRYYSRHLDTVPVLCDHVFQLAEILAY